MNNIEKTLVILTPGFPKDEADSTCLPLQQQLIRTLKEINPQLNIVVLSLQYPFHTKKYSWFNTIIIPFNSKGGLSRLFVRRKLNATLRKIHSATPITVLFSFWYGECAIVGKQFADRHGLKHFCWILGQDAKKDNKYTKRTQPQPGELIALSDFLQAEFERNHGIKPGHIIPAGINTQLFNTNRKEKDIDIIGAGSLIPLKQYDIFLETIAKIKKQIPGIKATLIGKGPEKDRVQLLITQLKLQSNVSLTGELPYHEVLERMQRAKVFLHPSSYEGFGVVSIEALYAGCHVISFTRPMKQEIAHWHIVSSKEEMIQKAMTILENPATVYKRVLFCTIREVAKKMTALFFKSI
ncbi:MAG TPA: glycosyltransferase [Chitinophagaceae bacterium]|nr:glycosyltransferase [Chitinophagaceae bacterium]